MEYEVSIRVELPMSITEVLRKEKDRFTSAYGSKYKSEPHITLYLDSYSEEGFSPLIRDLQGIRIEPFPITIIGAKVNLELNRHRYLYVVDLSKKVQLEQLHNKIQAIAKRYHSPFLREKVRKQLEQQGIPTNGRREDISTKKNCSPTFDPHITLGAVDLNVLQPCLAEVHENIKCVLGAEITISSFSVTLYAKQPSEEKFKMIQRAMIQLN